jgi:hypothetical protein
MDRPTTDQGDQLTDRPAADHTPCSIDEAAERLGITPNAVRQRLKRGTLAGSKTAEGWVVWMSPTMPTDQATADDQGRSATDQPRAWSRPTTNQPPTTVDLQPFADLIERLTMQASTAGYWQARALQAEERLKALESGLTDREPDAATAANEGPGGAMLAATTDDATRLESSRWGRFWRAVTGR